MKTCREYKIKKFRAIKYFYWKDVLIPDSDVRSENLVDTNVCCSEDDLNSDVREASNWSLTKDPKRCDEFEEDGYK